MPHGTDCPYPIVACLGGVTKETFLIFFSLAGSAWQTICIRHSGKFRFDSPNGCWPMTQGDSYSITSHKTQYEHTQIFTCKNVDLDRKLG